MAAWGVRGASRNPHGASQPAAPVCVPSGRLRLTYATFVYLVVTCVLISNACAAYEIKGVPVPWFAYCFAALGLMVVARRAGGRIRVPPATGLVGLLLVYAVLVQILGVLKGLEVPMPPRAPTPYPGFVLTRFAVLFGLGVARVFVYNAAGVVGREKLSALVRGVGVAVSLAAIYVYLARRYGWWEPPRHRVGTGGQDFLQQGIAFSYA